MDDEKLCLISVGLVILVFAGLAGMTYIDEEGWPWQDKEKKEETLLIQEGDEVSVEYVGRFVGSAGEPGAVFDTSMRDIAENDSIPKSITFEERTTYDDLTFTVGSGQMIEGFEDAVINKQIGESFTIAIPPEKAYGTALDEWIITVNATQTMQMKETLPLEEFQTQYPSVDLETIEDFVHPFWGWDIHIMSYDPEEVRIWHQPVYGQDYLAFPWNATVVDISTERNVITLHHNLEEITSETRVPFSMISTYDQEWSDAAQNANTDSPDEGLVTSKGGVITIDFNSEVAGKTLIFTITIIDIVRE
jgi:FKBP-type peptidyl-prolyl cis-trans isomerase 2